MANHTSRGQQRDKPYREALRMELAAAGDDLKALRLIARAHIAAAQNGDMPAIKELADRLDGKPAQETHVTRLNITASDLTDDELASIAVGLGEGTEAPPIDPQQLN
jgi:hypothetical protein